MSAVRRRWLIAALAAAFVTLVLYALLWREGAKVLRHEIEAWADDQRAAGVAVAYSHIGIAGFPFMLRGVVSDVSIAQGEAWRWSAKRLFVDAALWAPDRLAFSPGTQAIDIAEFGRWRIESVSGRAVIAIDRTSGWRLHIQSGRGRISNESGSFTLRSKRFNALITPEGAERNDVRATIAVAGLELPGRNRNVEATSLDFDFAVAAAEDGGPRTFTIRRFELDGEQGKVLVSGVFTVDAQGYPEGELFADIANPGVFATALGELGALSMDSAEAAAAMLSLAAIAGGGRVAAPMIFKDGEASVAGVRIAKLPKVD